MKYIPSILVSLVLLAFASSLDAQVLRGRLLDEGTGTPIGGAFVRLVDANGKRVSETLSHATGVYVARATAPGTYKLHVEMLGYRTYVSPPFTMDSSMVRDIRMPQVAIELPPINASTTTRCNPRNGMAAAAATMWEEVRKALAITTWTTQQGNIVFQILSTNRTLDARDSHVLSELKDITTSATRGSPFSTLSPDSLFKGGFIQAEGDGTYSYYGPDADLILSEQFMDTHCFHAVLDRKNPNAVGLAFEPAGRIKPSDVRGVLWLDKKSYLLDRLEFSYSKLPVDAPAEAAGGSMRFKRLDTGMWILSQWTLRAPLMTEPDRRGNAHYGGIQELTQQVISAYAGDSLVFRSSGN